MSAAVYLTVLELCEASGREPPFKQSLGICSESFVAVGEHEKFDHQKLKCLKDKPLNMIQHISETRAYVVWAWCKHHLPQHTYS